MQHTKKSQFNNSVLQHLRISLQPPIYLCRLNP